MEGWGIVLGPLTGRESRQVSYMSEELMCDVFFRLSRIANQNGMYDSSRRREWGFMGGAGFLVVGWDVR